MTLRSDSFPTDLAGAPDARPTASFDLADGQAFDLGIAPVAKTIGDATVRMLAYNGSIPGPTLRVRQGSAPAAGHPPFRHPDPRGGRRQSTVPERAPARSRASRSVVRKEEPP